MKDNREKDDRDVHAETAALVFGKPPEAEVTPEERSVGQVVNFGALYGAGDRDRLRRLVKMGSGREPR